MKIQIPKMNIKLALYLYTFILIIAGIFTAFSIVTNSDRLAFAQSACNTQELEACTQRAIQWCVDNIPAANSSQREQCVNSAYNNCVSTCTPTPPTNNNTTPNTNLIYDCYTGGIFEGCPNQDGQGRFGRTNQQTCIMAAQTLNCYSPNSNRTITGRNPTGATCARWRVYECTGANACPTAGNGCQGNVIGENLTEAQARDLLNSTNSCSVRQADCMSTQASPVLDFPPQLFISQIRCAANCYPTNTVVTEVPDQPQQTSPAACEHPCGPSDNSRACQNGLTCTNLGGVYKCRLTDHPEWIACQPPQTQTVACNDECNTTDKLCGNGLTCTNIAGINRCRLPANPSSATCQPEQPQTVACNDECNTTNRLCGNGLTCTNVAGTNRCRLPANPSSANCQPAVVQPKCNDLCNNTDLLCPSGLSCTNIDGTNRCRLPSNTSSATCQPQEVIPPNYKIEKVLEGNQGPFNIGELVTFRVRITNIGQTTLTNVRFRDVYNSNYITYVGGSAIKSSGGSISDINPHLTLKINGEIQIANVASSSVLGSIAPGNYYEFTLKFIAKAPTSSTCNVGYADLPDLPEISDDACLPIKNIDTDL